MARSFRVAPWGSDLPSPWSNMRLVRKGRAKARLKFLALGSLLGCLWEAFRSRKACLVHEAQPARKRSVRTRTRVAELPSSDGKRDTRTVGWGKSPAKHRGTAAVSGIHAPKSNTGLAWKQHEDGELIESGTHHAAAPHSIFYLHFPLDVLAILFSLVRHHETSSHERVRHRPMPKAERRYLTTVRTCARSAISTRVRKICKTFLH